jgi:hypothetical protein
VIDERERFEHAFSHFEMPEPGLERLLRRRDRKRRTQRVTAGVVGMAVFVAAIWIVTTVGTFDRARTPGTSGPDPAPPSVTDPTPGAAPRPDQVGFVGLAPRNATPSTPAHGELVVSLYGRSTTDNGRFRAWVYADGRIIWDREGDFPFGANETTTGLLEQHLTPEGVERMRSEIVSTGLFDHDLTLLNGHLREKASGQQVPTGVIWGTIQVRDGGRLVSVSWSNPEMYPQDTGTAATPQQASALERLDGLLTHPGSWLPASSWRDEEITAYVPSRYAVCYSAPDRALGASRIVSLLPAAARELLGSRDRTRYGASDTGNYCSVVTTEEARALAETFDAAGLRLDDRSSDSRLGYLFESPDVPHGEVSIYFEPYLPDDQFLLCSPCG